MQKILKLHIGNSHIMNWIKILLCMAAMVVSMLMFMGNIGTALATTLKKNIMIESENITVGDIFHDVYRNADYVLGPAPEPGEEMVLGASTLHRIARSFDISWTPQNGYESVILRRSNNVIGMKDTTRELIKAISDMDDLGNFDVELDEEKFYVSLPEGEEKSFRFENIQLNKTNKRFTATLIAPAHGLALTKKDFSGSYYHVAKVPVLKERLRHGDIISKHDIDFISMREKDLTDDVLTRAEDVIGYTPRRVMISGKPLRVHELVAPKLVKRGDRVTIHYKQGPIVLSAIGKALQPGAKDDIIRVVNLTSNRTIDAQVTSEREVHVATIK